MMDDAVAICLFTAIDLQCFPTLRVWKCMNDFASLELTGGEESVANS